MDYYQVHPSYFFEIVGESVYLFDGYHRKYELKGRVSTAIFSLLKKSGCKKKSLLQKLKKEFSLELILYTLLSLEKKGFVYKRITSFSKEVVAICGLLGVAPEVAEEKIRHNTITIETFGKVSKNEIEKALMGMNLLSGKDGKIHLFVADHYLFPELVKKQKYLFEQNKISFFIKTSGPQIWVGPLIIPHRTSCYLCLRHALNENRTEELMIENKIGRTFHPIVLKPSLFRTTAINLGVSELFKWVIGANDKLENSLINYDFINSEKSVDRILRRDFCDLCGSKQKQKEKIVLSSRPKAKSANHEKIFQKYKHLISPRVGIVNFLVPTIGENRKFSTYKAGHNISQVEYRVRPSMHGKKSASGGKGITEIEAKVSCLCEAVERYSGIFQGKEQTIQASYEELGERALHLDTLQFFSQRQFQERDAWNRKSHHFHYVPPKFDERKKISWTPIFSLTENRWKWIPVSYAYYSASHGLKDKHFFSTATSNGCAAGNTPEEAMLQGLLELIERDAVALWWYSKIQRNGINLESFDHPFIPEFVQYYRQNRREVWALDLTSDLGIPTVVAFSRLTGAKSEKIMFGFGTCLEIEKALLRALTEMHQWRESDIFNPESELENPLKAKWLSNKTVLSEPYLLPNPHLPYKEKRDFPNLQSDDFTKELLLLKNRIENKGLELLALDQTRPHINMPVFRMVVPHLRHFWNQLAPGRLYDVPVSMGWLSKPLKENELNDLPIFL